MGFALNSLAHEQRAVSLFELKKIVDGVVLGSCKRVNESARNEFMRTQSDQAIVRVCLCKSAPPSLGFV